MKTNKQDLLEYVDHFEQSLLSFDRTELKEIMGQGLEQLSPIEFVEQVVVPALDRMGKGWEKGELALSQIYMGGRICEELIDEILPPKAPERIDQPNMAICVLDDYHFLGKRIVYATLRAAGFELKDYHRVTVDEVVPKIMADGIQIILISVLMLPSALKIKKMKQRLDSEGYQGKLVVGGAPFCFDDTLWQEVGADAMCYTASQASETINKLSGRS